MHVIKRDGTRVLFNPDKIVQAINKAMISTYGAVYETETAEEIADLIGQRNVDMSVALGYETDFDAFLAGVCGKFG